jgi:hypothetical protein
VPKSVLGPSANDRREDALVRGLLSGIVMERHGVGPVEGGRRLVDIVREGFA